MSDNIKNRLPQDSLGNPIQVANTFRTYDNAIIKITSPVSIADGLNQLITIPNNAAIITLYTTQQLKVGITQADVEGGVGSDGYAIAPVGIPTMLGITSCESLYLRNDSGSEAILYFSFSMV